MKKLNPKAIERESHQHLTFEGKRAENFKKVSHVFEVQAHNRVTVDMQSTFMGAAKVFKELRDRHLPVRLFRISNTTGRKTEELINPLY